MSEEQANDPRARADRAGAGEDVSAGDAENDRPEAEATTGTRMSDTQLAHERADGTAHLFPDAGSLFEPEREESVAELDAEVREAERHDRRFADGPDEWGVAESNFGQNTTE